MTEITRRGEKGLDGVKLLLIRVLVLFEDSGLLERVFG